MGHVGRCRSSVVGGPALQFNADADIKAQNFKLMIFISSTLNFRLINALSL